MRPRLDHTARNALAVAAISVQESMVSPLVAPLLDARGLSLSAIGLLIAAYPLASLLSRLPGGLLYRGDRARFLTVLALASSAAACAIYPLVAGAVPLAALRLVHGLAMGLATTVNLALYIDGLPAAAPRHRLMAYYAAAQALGYAAGGFTSGSVADQLGFGVAFLVAAGVTLLAIPLTAAIPRPATAMGTVAAPQPAAGSRGLGRSSLAALLDPKVAALVLVGLVLNVLFHFGGSFFPLYGLAVGLSLTEIGAIRSAYALANAAVRPLSGSIIDRFGHQRLSDWGLVVHALLLLAVPALWAFWPLLGLFVLAGAARAVVLVANTIAVVEDVDASRVGRGVASGLLNAGRDLGNIGGPLLGGLLAAALGVVNLFLAGPPLIMGFYLGLRWASLRLAPAPRPGREAAAE